MKRTIFSPILAVFLAAAGLVCPFFAAGASAEAPGVSAARGILMDADTGAVLWARSPDEPGLIASTTKIMTAYLICEAGEPDRPVTVPAEAAGVEGSSLYLREGEILTREELLLGLMLHSGNDAAVTLAVDAAGSVSAFAGRMNEAAARLGLRNTHFANPHGLDSAENYASSRDLALLTAAAMQNDAFRRIVSAKTASVSGGRVLTNHNKLLWRFDGCIGVKTGYTRAAGRLLVSAAERGGRTLICVTANDPDDWRDHTALLDWGFSAYVPRSVAEAGKPLLDDDFGGPLIARASLSLPLRAEEEPELRFVPGLRSDLLPGADAGTVKVCLNGRCLAEVPVSRPQTPQGAGSDHEQQNTDHSR